MIIDWTQFHESKANCFRKNGEEYIVLPHLLQSSFRQFSSDEIEKACDQLNIKLLLCNSEELTALKSRGILPEDCFRPVGLIRRSDAERLRKTPPLTISCRDVVTTRQLQNSHHTFIPVQHNCFGFQNGKLFPHLYDSALAACILCDACDELFSPASFVGHSHSLAEVQNVVHWGFDSSLWRFYLYVDESQGELSLGYRLPEYAQMLEDIKEKFFNKELSLEQCAHRLEKLNLWNSSSYSFTLSTLPDPPEIITKSDQIPWPEHIERGKPVELSEDSIPIPLHADPSTIENYNDRVPNIALKPVTLKSKKPNLPDLLDIGLHSSTVDLNTSPRSAYLKTFQQRVVRRTATEDISYPQRLCTNAQLALVKAIFAIDEASSPTTSTQLLRLFEDVKRSHQLMVLSIQQETLTLKKRLAQRNIQKEEHIKQPVNASLMTSKEVRCKDNADESVIECNNTSITRPVDTPKLLIGHSHAFKRKASPPIGLSVFHSKSTSADNFTYPMSYKANSNKKKHVWITSYEEESDRRSYEHTPCGQQ